MKYGFTLALVFVFYSGCSYTPECSHPRSGELANPSGLIEYNGSLYIINADTSMKFCLGYISEMNTETGDITGQWEAGKEGSGFMARVGLWKNEGIGYMLITERNGNSLLSFNLDNKSVDWQINTGEDPFGIAVDDSRNLALITDLQQNSIAVFDLVNQREVGRIVLPISVHGYRPTSIVISPDYKTAYISGELGAYIVRMDIENMAIYSESINLAGSLTGLDTRGLALNDETLYAAMRTPPAVGVIDTATGGIINFVPLRDKPAGIAIDGSGRYIFVTEYSKNTLFVIESATGNIVRDITTGDGPEEVIVTQDGRFVFTANFRGNSISRVEVGTWDVKEFPSQ